jgi:hypothetical protein
MDIQFRPDDSDYVAAQTAWFMRHPTALGRQGLFFLLMLALMPLILIDLASRPGALRAALPRLLVIAALPVISYVLIRRNWQKKFAKSSLANTDVSATVDERGVTLSANGQQKTHSWAGFSSIYESSRVVVFEKGYGDFVHLPKRAMSPAQLAELVQLASLAINCKVRLAPPLA